MKRKKKVKPNIDKNQLQYPLVKETDLNQTRVILSSSRLLDSEIFLSVYISWEAPDPEYNINL